MSVLSRDMTGPEAGASHRAVLDELHVWVVTVDHKRLGIMYVHDGRPRRQDVHDAETLVVAGDDPVVQLVEDGAMGRARFRPRHVSREHAHVCDLIGE